MRSCGNINPTSVIACKQDLRKMFYSRLQMNTVNFKNSHHLMPMRACLGYGTGLTDAQVCSLLPQHLALNSESQILKFSSKKSDPNRFLYYLQIISPFWRKKSKAVLSEPAQDGSCLERYCRVGCRGIYRHRPSPSLIPCISWGTARPRVKVWSGTSRL